MCGLLGIIAPEGKTCDLSRSDLIRMRDTMTSRGPDGANVLVMRNLAFAHRRLAIRDVEHGEQPWLDSDRRYALLYNGELYNDTALRRELKELGHTFSTRCDTEVVLAAYRQWGRQCVERLHGMFAFAIYDFVADRLFCARDRFGIKPLFLTTIDGELMFASSIRALIEHPRFRKQPNLNAISHYLTTFRVTLGRETMFAGIWQLLPGERMSYHKGRITVERYWDYPEPSDEEPTFAEAVDRLEHLLAESVRGHLASDVPVGMFLSGGVDSSMLAGLMRNATGRSFSVACGGGTDESAGDFPHARACADRLRLDYDEVRLSPDEYRRDWNELLDGYATPVSTPSDVVIYAMSRRMKRSVGVVLGGEGADELMCGYAVQHWSGVDYDLSVSLKRGSWTPRPAVAGRYSQSLQSHYGTREFSSPVEQYFNLNSLISARVKAEILRPEIWRQLDGDRPIFERYAREFSRWGARPTPEIVHRLLHRVNLESLLARFGTATMAAGLEGRVPYTDHRLVEEIFKLPQHYRIDIDPAERSPYLAAGELHQRGSLRSKRILRSLAEKHLPTGLARRPKASFPTPVEHWIKHSWRDEWKQIVQQSPFGRRLFHDHALHAAGEQIERIGMRAWPIVNLLAWGDRHFERAA